MIQLFTLWMLMGIGSFRSPEAKNHDAPADFPSVRIGDQIWMNFNWDYPTPKSWYFDNDSIGNKKYGRLYFYSNAVAAAPPGWHLPSIQEWQQLIDYYGGDAKALPFLLEGGSSGLNLLMGGNKSAKISPTDIFNFKDEWGFYWTSTTDGEQTAYAVHFEKGNASIIKNTYRRANGFSVRYVKNQSGK